MIDEKEKVKAFWESAACGENLYLPEITAASFLYQATKRYELEPYISDFADFSRWEKARVLEIGVGLGSDHQRFAEAGANMFGIDLTERAIQLTAARLKCFNLNSKLKVGDAERLEYPDNFFDLVYSWGVIHHSPNTAKAVQEILRVLRPGGHFRVMIYHKYSLVGFMLWIRYALMIGRPFRSLDDIYAHHLESPGTKAYTRTEAANLFSGAENLRIETVLTHGDLLEGAAGQRHRGILLALGRRLLPRKLIRRLLPRAGLFMLISGIKPLTPSNLHEDMPH